MKKILNSIKMKWQDMKKPSLIEWILLGVLLLFCYLSFNHGDIVVTSTHGEDLLSLILKGQFLNFYDYTQSTAVYLIPIYIIFAIWSIPINIIFAIFNIPIWGVIDYGGINFYMLMWYKLLPVIFTVLSALVLYKIGRYVGMKDGKAKWMVFVFMSIPILVFSQFIFGQYDSICMFFTLLSFYYFLQKKYYKFAILMSIAITFKMFALFLFIPLVLLFEKRFWHILKYLLIGLFGTIFCNLLFMGSPGFTDAKNFTGNMFQRFFYSGIPTVYGVVSLFILILIGICVFAYLKKIDEHDKFSFYNWSIYICLAIYSSLFMSILWHPQWLLILTPFIVLAAFMNDNLKTSIILNITASIGYLLIVVTYFAGNVDELLINRGIFAQIFQHTLPMQGHIASFLTRFSFLNNNVFVTIFFASLLINLIIKFPTKDRIKNNEALIASNDIKVPRGYIIAETLTIFIYIIPTLYLFFVSLAG